jgi:hypothetical protein
MNEATRRAFQTLHRLNREEAEQSGAFEPRATATEGDWRTSEPEHEAWLSSPEQRRFNEWQRRAARPSKPAPAAASQRDLCELAGEVGDDVGLLQTQVAALQRELAELRAEIAVLRDERVAMFPRRAGAA